MKDSLFHTAIQLFLTSLYCSAAKCLTDPQVDNEKNEELRHSRFRSLYASQKRFLRKEEEETLVEMYFGAGSYWYIQHELVQAERSILHRSDDALTSRTGYAGGTGRGSEGRVCYHNFDNIADYVKLGHAEVVGIFMPEDAVQNFSKAFLNIFDPETGERAGSQDRGPEFRSLIGIPDGLQNPLFDVINATASVQGFRFEVGNGDDPDSYGRDKLVYIYDVNKFPFYQAEVSMQFRDDIQSSFGKDYNSLVELALDDGRIVGQGCPDIF